MNNTILKSNKYKICIVKQSAIEYSETFIRNHIERLPSVVGVLSENSLPSYLDETGCRKNKNSLFHDPYRLMWRAGISFRNCYRELKSSFFLLRHSINGVLAEYGPAGIAMMRTCEKLGIPLIVHFHGVDAYHSSILSGAGRLYPELFKKAAAVVAVSHDMEDQLLKLGAPRNKLHYNPCGVDIEIFQRGNPAQAPPTFLSVGRFVDKKAPHLTILAFNKVIKQIPNARLVMVGNGLLLEACKQMVRALNIAGSIEFLGVLSNIGVADLMRKVRALVQHSCQTSYGDSEGTPLSVLEAGASGVPVVATKHAGIGDVVIDGMTGYLIDEGNIEKMAEKMFVLGSNPSLAEKLGLAARDKICREFSMDQRIDNLWKIIESSIGRN